MEKTKQDSEAFIKAYVKEKAPRYAKGFDVRDFDLDGSETENDLKGYADDYISDCDSDEAEYFSTAQDRYDEEHEWETRQSELIETYRNES